MTVACVRHLPKNSRRGCWARRLVLLAQDLPSLAGSSVVGFGASLIAISPDSIATCLNSAFFATGGAFVSEREGNAAGGLFGLKGMALAFIKLGRAGLVLLRL